MTNKAKSYSQLGTYETCALKYKFRYKDGLRTPKGPAAQRGTDLHSSIEGYLKGEKSTVRKEAATLKKVLAHVKGQNPFIEHRVGLDETLMKYMPWDEAYFRLVLDSAYIYGNEVHVQEWKSGKVYDDHADQRRLYAVGALAAFNAMQYAHVVTYYLDQNLKKTIVVDLAQRQPLAEQYVRRLQVLENDKHFAPRPGLHCRWCDYSRYKGGPCPVA
jgi:CRISPR/Cas system-associated exonuclease Cas4 (RecB family)